VYGGDEKTDDGLACTRDLRTKGFCRQLIYIYLFNLF
jgi:hypothetical protein